MKEGVAVKISKEAYERLEEIRKTSLGKIPRGVALSNIILQFKNKGTESE